jgi:hypothetical protein
LHGDAAEESARRDVYNRLVRVGVQRLDGRRERGFTVGVRANHKRDCGRGRRVSEDTAIGILFAGMFALGVVLTVFSIAAVGLYTLRAKAR